MRQRRWIVTDFFEDMLDDGTIVRVWYVVLQELVAVTEYEPGLGIYDEDWQLVEFNYTEDTQAGPFDTEAEAEAWCSEQNATGTRREP